MKPAMAMRIELVSSQWSVVSSLFVVGLWLEDKIQCNLEEEDDKMDRWKLGSDRLTADD